MFKPMLASDANLDLLRYPLIASPKLDGVRATVRDGVVYSRSNKPIPNKHVHSLFKNCEYHDGELIVGDPTSPTVYRDTVSEVMSHDKTNGCMFYVFDHIELMDKPYFVRQQHIIAVPGTSVTKLFGTAINNIDDLLAYEETCLTAGYEGLILRDPLSAYKQGRSTAKEGILLKLKRFVDAEARIIGFEERMENTNEKTTNELGRSARSSHKAGKIGRGDLGAIHVDFNGLTFYIGTGFNDKERRDIWDKRDTYVGALVKFKSFPIGVKDAPRHPVFLGFRNKIDMS